MTLRRRDFISLAGGAAAWPLAARAQRANVPIIGWLYAGSRQGQENNEAAFLKGLREMGFVEGQNVTIEHRWADNNYDRLAGLVADLVRQGPAAIYVDGGAVVARAAKAATATIPIVFHVGQDPVKTDLVASFNRPGGNLTGISFINEALTAKRLELLHDLIPAASRFAALLNPSNPTTHAFESAEAQKAADALGRHINFFDPAPTTRSMPRSRRWCKRGRKRC